MNLIQKLVLFSKLLRDFEKKMNEENLPPFARELLRRRNQTLNVNQNSFSRSLPKPLYSSQNSTNFNEMNLYENNAELVELRSIISNLEQQIADLTSKKKSVDHLKSVLESEQNNSSELQSQLGKINDSIKENENKNEAYSEQITQLQSFLDNKQQIIDVKSAMVTKLNDAYQQLKIDYDNEIKKSSDQIAELNQLRARISELNDEASVLRSQKRIQSPIKQNRLNMAFNNNSSNNYFDYQQDSLNQFQNNSNRNGFDDFNFPPQTADQFDYPINNANNSNPIPTPDFDSFGKIDNGNSFEQPEFNPTVRISPVHPALYDSIKFGDDSETTNEQNNPEIDIGMSFDEMKKSLTEMQARKTEIESILNKSPPKQMKIAEARRERMKNESELNELEQKISKIRLALKSKNKL